MDRSDVQPPEPAPDEPDLSFLPEVIGVESVLRTYRKPRFRTRGPEVEEAHHAVEITIETSEPFPERALGPVLLVGRVELNEGERIGPNRYRFYAYDVEKLKEGSPIRLGWFNQPRPRQQTGFRFALGDKRRGK
jgi:hypothetical protein